MKCLNCGTELNDNIKFCTNCGVEVKGEEVNNINNINNELAIEEERVVNNMVGVKPIDSNNINNQNAMHSMNDISNNNKKKVIRNQL